MKVLRDTPGAPDVSIIWLDWSVRESFHSLDYLARQTVPRGRYELIWIEYYDSVPGGLESKVAEHEREGRTALDQWVVLEAGREIMLHKHFCYNVGFALARGKICVVCDSDVIFPLDFIERIIRTFDEDSGAALHIDEIRNANPSFYPFNYPSVDEILRDPMTINWTGKTTRGLADSSDMLHEANYGACMAARREDLIAIGGSDEHTDYLGYICGPYELTFRLVNRGLRERWLDDIFLIHTWHPGEGGANNAGGPHDGRGFSTRALDVRRSGTWMPGVENEVISALRERPQMARTDVIDRISRIDLAKWHRDAVLLEIVEPPALARENVAGHNVIRYKNVYYAFPQSEGAFLPPRADAGEYDRFARDMDLLRLVRRLQQPERAGTLKRAMERLRRLLPAGASEPPESIPQSAPVLVRENVAECNIVLYEGTYYALPQASGPFLVDSARSGQYRALKQSLKLDDLLRSLQS